MRVMLAGDTVSVKSFCEVELKVNVAAVVCVRPPEAAVIVTV